MLSRSYVFLIYFSLLGVIFRLYFHWRIKYLISVLRFHVKYRLVYLHNVHIYGVYPTALGAIFDYPSHFIHFRRVGSKTHLFALKLCSQDCKQCEWCIIFTVCRWIKWKSDGDVVSDRIVSSRYLVIVTNSSRWCLVVGSCPKLCRMNLIWNVSLRCWASSYRRFEGTCRFHLLGPRSS